jgi:hypothetical protein
MGFIQSKIVRLNFDKLSYRADSELVELHAEVQNPKSKIPWSRCGIPNELSHLVDITEFLVNPYYSQPI